MSVHPSDTPQFGGNWSPCLSLLLIDAHRQRTRRLNLQYESRFIQFLWRRRMYARHFDRRSTNLQEQRLTTTAEPRCGYRFKCGAANPATHSFPLTSAYNLAVNVCVYRLSTLFSHSRGPHLHPGKRSRGVDPCAGDCINTALGTEHGLSSQASP